MEFFIPMWVLMTPVVLFGTFMVWQGLYAFWWWKAASFDGAQVFRLICVAGGLGLIVWGIA